VRLVTCTPRRVLCSTAGLPVTSNGGPGRAAGSCKQTDMQAGLGMSPTARHCLLLPVPERALAGRAPSRVGNPSHTMNVLWVAYSPGGRHNRKRQIVLT
jgi:hypothetical protein